MDERASKWEPLERPIRGLTAGRLAVVVAGAAAIIIVTVEITSATLRIWFQGHPATVGVIVSLAFLVLTVLLVERWLAHKESDRWRAPAFAALDAYIHTADGIGKPILEKANEMVAALPTPEDAIPCRWQRRR